MKQFKLKSIAAIALFAASGIAADAAPRPAIDRNAPLSRMRQVRPTHRWSGHGVTGTRQRISPDHSLPATDSFQYLYGPDGSEWYATCDYEVESVVLEGGYTSDQIKGFTYTIYDTEFKKIGTIHDTISFEEGESRCAQVMMDINVTKKFFNYDDKYEVMVTLCMNAENYSMNIRTNVYSIGGMKSGDNDVPVTVIGGYPVDAVNLATKSWDEYFYITFLTEEKPDPDDYEEYLDYLSQFKEVLTTYTKATTSNGGEASVLFEHKIPMINLPGDQMSCPMMLSKNVDGKLTLMYQQYEKSFFIDPTGMGGNEDITPDNNLVIDIYQLAGSYSKEMEQISTTRIATPPVEDEGTLYTFYGIGNLLFDGDVDFHNYSSDGTPCFIVSRDEYLRADDDNYNSSYYVYDVNGNRIKTLAEDTYNYVLMSDIQGFEPQAMFIHTGDEYTFEFVDLISAQTSTTVDQMYRGFGLSASIDRVPSKDGYVYAVATTNGIVETEEDGVNKVLAPVCWLGKDGELIRLDNVPVGEGVELAQLYIASEALSPYVYNTDTDIEYMLLVKRRTPDGTSLQEEFLVATTEKGVIHSFLPDEEKGAIATVTLLTGENPQLVIAYNKNYQYSTDSYTLPFTKFAGGNGSATDPYLIATAGDLMQIRSNPSASYRVEADIDCAGVSLPSVQQFSGTLDGSRHTIANVALYGNDKVGLFSECAGATIRNLDFFDCKVSLGGNDNNALLAGTAMNSTFDNIHIRRLNVSGDDFSGSFAPVASQAWTNTSFASCEVSDAAINLPQATKVAGIASDLRTGTTITASSFNGTITAANTIGGIVASTTTGDEVISNCHVDADLKAENTIGGVVGFLDRSSVRNCYVEGTLEATTPSKWNKTLSVGGIAGELEGDWEKTSNVPVTNNLIGISEIRVPDMSGVTEDYPHQLATVHRIVGRTSYNTQLDEEEAKNGPIYETGVVNNLVVSDLAVIDSDFDEKTIEGTSIAKEDVNTEMLESELGFTYGKDSSAPWNIQSWNAWDPQLYYENSICIPYSSINATEGEIFSIEVALLSRTPMTADDILDNFMCDFNEGLMEMTGDMDFDGKTMTIGFKALKEGTSQFTVSLLDGTAGCLVNITKPQSTTNPGAVESIAEGSTLNISNGVLTASGSMITVYDMQGHPVISGIDRLDTASLSSGIYVATATSTAGTSTLKFAK